MATAATLERQLRVGGEVLSIVGTMKGLAAVSIHEFEEAVGALREYTHTIELGHPGGVLNPSGADPLRRPPGRTAGRHRGRHRSGPVRPHQPRDRPRSLPLAGRALGGAGRQVGVGPRGRTTRELGLMGIPPDQEMPLASSVEAVGP